MDLISGNIRQYISECERRGDTMQRLPGAKKGREREREKKMTKMDRGTC